MSHFRIRACLLATFLLLAASIARADGTIGIQPIPDQDIPSGKTLVVPVPATDPDGPARSYTISIGTPTVNGTAVTKAGVVATIRTGDPHFFVGVSYTDSNSVQQTGTMEFQLLREFAPITTQIVGGLAQGGFYNPEPQTNGTTNYITFFRVQPPSTGQTPYVIQGGDPDNDGAGGPGFVFPNEFSSTLIFSGTGGQLGMANDGDGVSDGLNGTNGSEFFITFDSERLLDYGYSIFGQMLRGFDTLEGIGGTPLEFDSTSPVSPVNITSASVAQNDTDALLLLSATGICDAVVTVTASSGGVTTVQTFTAHAVADATNDPPFLHPVPDITAPNGAVKVSLPGTDLQLDLLRYGYQHLLPVMDSNATTNTTPVFSIPLISNTDNEIAATLDHWNPSSSPHGPDGRVFHVGAGDKPITGSLTPIPAGRNGTLVFNSGPLAVFTTGNASDTAASFSASVNWGDGTFVSGSNVGIEKAAGVRKFELLAGHAYGTAGEFPIIVKIKDPGGARLLLTGTANVSASPIAIAGAEIDRATGTLKNQVLATFTDAGSAATAASYSATIDWGDGSVSAGTVKSGANASYQVVGSHVYKSPETFTVSATVTRGGAGGYSATEWSAAHISGVAAPQVFPPFPQAHLAQMWSTILSNSNALLSTGTNTGSYPFAGLVAGTDGNLYGTTSQGGVNGLDGTVFKITTAGSLTSLQSFNGTNGANPIAGLLQGADGNLYGTTENGGADSDGTVFQITTSGSLARLYSFTGGSDGAKPLAGLTTGTDGNLYGATVTGGTNSEGTVFQISTAGALATICTFSALSSGTNPDGANPYAGLVTGMDGNLYGTTEGGGASGAGTVYRITTTGSLTTLYSFTGGSDGANPYAGLITGTDGNLYGTTSGGGIGEGTVFQITTTGSLNTLYTFTGGSDGANPRAALVTGTDGNLYGTAVNGGNAGFGTVFQLNYAGAIDSLYSFTGGNDGENPYGGLVVGTDGNLYGTTETGGINGGGTVFQISTAGSLDTLYSFTGNSFQISLRCAVAIFNSGDRTSSPGSFSVYVDPNGELDGQQTVFTSKGQSSFAVPALAPGQYVLFSFRLDGSTDTRLKLPAGFNPNGQEVIGVVTYSDPVGDFDGSQKIVSPGSF